MHLMTRSLDFNSLLTYEMFDINTIHILHYNGVMII